MRFARLPPLPLLPAFFWLPLFIFMAFRRHFGFLFNSQKYQNLENLKEPNIPKSRKSQYIENLKDPNKDLVVVLYVFNLDVVCAPFFYLFIYIYTKSEKGEHLCTTDILFFCYYGKLLKFSIYRNSQYTKILIYKNSQYTKILNIPQFWNSEILKFSIYQNSQYTTILKFWNSEILNIPKIWNDQNS